MKYPAFTPISIFNEESIKGLQQKVSSISVHSLKLIEVHAFEDDQKVAITNKPRILSIFLKYIEAKLETK